MRKLTLQIQLSLDGFAAGPHGEQDWMTWDWDASLNDYVNTLTVSADTMLIGRVTYEGMAQYWPDAATNPDASADEIAFAQRMNTIDKIVFSSTLKEVTWTNARLAQKSARDEIEELKQQPGKDLIIYGGAGIVSSFIRQNLIDEYHLFINPVILGKGMPIWQEITESRILHLVKTTTSTVGIVILHYVKTE